MKINITNSDIKLVAKQTQFYKKTLVAKIFY